MTISRPRSRRPLEVQAHLLAAVGDFQDPKIGIHKVYTRAGDDGKTALVGGQRVAKDDARIEAYGSVDELNAVVGLCAEHAEEAGLDDMAARLRRIQHALFNAGSILATLPADRGDKQPRVRPSDIDRLEAWMDEANAHLPALTSFVLPGGSHLNAALHLARTVCRRAERQCVTLHRAAGDCAVEVRYLNRLSDAFFVWSRDAARRLGHAEVLWSPDHA